jgi:hypothetical protein
MKYANFRSITLAATLLLMSATLHGTLAVAARVSSMLSGNVTGVSGNQIIVDGRNYSVRLNSPALRELQQVQVGQKVDLVLSGAPQASATEVIGIHVHEAQH